MGNLDPAFLPLESFWSRCVFLRLSTNRLSQGSLATRKSFEPLLDEEGENLPALLNELTPEQRVGLVTSIQDILEGIRGVEVSSAETGRDTRVNYSLLERMPYQGRKGRRQFRIPAWMLSEGTRRITAILALLAREPAPSLLCIEEVENGLDPWTVRAILRHLESAADRGTQVIVTTHSPWLLDEVPIESIIQVRRIEGDTKYEHFASRPEIRAFDPSIPAGTRYVQEMG
jgi:predicted ATPase